MCEELFAFRSVHFGLGDMGDMGSNRQGEGGALGKYTGKIKHSKIKI